VPMRATASHKHEDLQDTIYATGSTAPVRFTKKAHRKLLATLTPSTVTLLSEACGKKRPDGEKNAAAFPEWRPPIHPPPSNSANVLCAQGMMGPASSALGQRERTGWPPRQGHGLHAIASRGTYPYRGGRGWSY
jgi:hypothetical protein